MSKHSHISAIFDNTFQGRAGSPNVNMSMDVHQVENDTPYLTFMRGIYDKGNHEVTYLGVNHAQISYYIRQRIGNQ